MEKKKLTSANGRLIADNQNTQTAGQRGPIMMLIMLLRWQ